MHCSHWLITRQDKARHESHTENTGRKKVSVKEDVSQLPEEQDSLENSQSHKVIVMRQDVG